MMCLGMMEDPFIRFNLIFDNGGILIWCDCLRVCLFAKTRYHRGNGVHSDDKHEGRVGI